MERFEQIIKESEDSIKRVFSPGPVPAHFDSLVIGALARRLEDHEPTQTEDWRRLAIAAGERTVNSNDPE